MSDAPMLRRGVQALTWHCLLSSLGPQPPGAEKPLRSPTSAVKGEPAQCWPGGRGAGEGVPHSVGPCCLAWVLPKADASSGCQSHVALRGGPDTYLPSWDGALGVGLERAGPRGLPACQAGCWSKPLVCTAQAPGLCP